MADKLQCKLVGSVVPLPRRPDIQQRIALSPITLMEKLPDSLMQLRYHLNFELTDCVGHFAGRFPQDLRGHEHIYVDTVVTIVIGMIPDGCAEAAVHGQALQPLGQEYGPVCLADDDLGAHYVVDFLEPVVWRHPAQIRGIRPVSVGAHIESMRLAEKRAEAFLRDRGHGQFFEQLRARVVAKSSVNVLHLLCQPAPECGTQDEFFQIRCHGVELGFSKGGHAVVEAVLYPLEIAFAELGPIRKSRDDVLPSREPPGVHSQKAFPVLRAESGMGSCNLFMP